jgi:hypothetical protein
MKNAKKTETPAEKIVHPELRKLAAAESDNVASVLIELNLPGPQVQLDKNQFRGVFDYSLKRVVPETPTQRKESQQQINKASAFLTNLLGEKPLWLNAGRAFVANVNADQLRKIARSPLTKAIRPNRKLEVYRSKK